MVDLNCVRKPTCNDIWFKSMKENRSTQLPRDSEKYSGYVNSAESIWF